LKLGKLSVRKLMIGVSLFFMVSAFGVSGAQENPASLETDSAIIGEPAGEDAAIKMLSSILELKKNLNSRILEKKEQLATSDSETQKNYLLAELEKLDKAMASANVDFERIATGVEIGLFAEKKSEHFDWKRELLSLAEPGIMELKRLTVAARHKTRLKDEFSFYQGLVPVAQKANEQLAVLASKTDDPGLKSDIERLMPEWNSVENQIQNKLDLVEMQIAEIERQETSLLESSQASVKKFFKNRGLFIFIAVLACIGVVLMLRVSYLFLMRFVPGYNARYRPFHIRVVELLYRGMTFFFSLFALIFVFYVFEDWVLLSLAIIFLMGVGWGAKNTLPRFWHQSRLMLNIGAVREGERLFYQGVPWLVKKINLFSTLENPSLGVSLRLPIEALMDKSSRPFHQKEPWFPCRRNDWVILADGTRGCVTSLSHEMVELVQRGGAQKVYQTGDFLAQSPLNLSVNFRLKVVFGIAYALQAESTHGVLQILEAYIQEQLSREGYQDALLNLRVEFSQAGASSLDLVIIADFKGEAAPLYMRLSRAIQRWCVDACTQNNWEIPFPQLTIHRQV
jgi:small-conductance mechanosensitive channel